MFQMDADILPGVASGTLTVRLHQMSSQRNNEPSNAFAQESQQTEIIYRGTRLRLIYEMVGPKRKCDFQRKVSLQIRRGQELLSST